MPQSFAAAFLPLLAALGLAPSAPTQVQGYVEAEYVLVAPQISGTLDALNVTRGGTVGKGAALFSLEHGAEDAALAEAEAAQAQRQAEIEDLLKSKRKPELDALIAQRDQASAAYKLAQINLQRDEKLVKTKAVSQADLDARQAELARSRAQCDEAEAALATGQLSLGRDDAIRAAQAALDVAKAAKTQAQWRKDQKAVAAPVDSFIFDTLYRPGEYIAAGQPVVSLLPPENIKVRFFVDAPLSEKLHLHDSVEILLANPAQPVPAHISYISPKAEYTPPQLYNRDNRERLLYMIEALPETSPLRLHPGQPVDVRLPETARP